MYEEKSRKLNIDWKSLGIKMLILLAVLFIVLWIISLVGKKNEPKKASNLTVNLKTMQSAANEYFTGSRLPENINGKKKITLGEMLDAKLLIEFKDQDNNTCNTTESYAEATKINKDDYTIKVKLVCGKESDYVIDTVTIKTDDIIGDNNIPNEDNNNDVPTDIPNDNDDNANSNGNSSSNNGSTTINRPNGNQQGNTTVEVSAIYINYKKIYLQANTSKSVMTVIYPANATNKTVAWSSSNEAVAKVSNGVVTGVSVGKAIITASAGGKSTTMEVEVLANSSSSNNNSGNNGSNDNSGCQYGTKDYSGYTPAYLISGTCAGAKSDYYNSTYSNQVSTLGANEYKKLVQEIANLKSKTGADVYVEAPVYSAIYNKTNTGFVGYQVKFVAKVRQSYSSKSIYEYYLNTDGSRKVILDNRSSLTNNNNNNTNILVNSITVNMTSLNLNIGGTYTLVASVNPYNATNKTVTWSSSNSRIASVVNGKVTGVSAGTAIITASAGGKSASTYVTVKANDYLDVATTNLVLDVDDIYNISAYSNGVIYYRSSDTNVLTVNSNGRITAKKKGKASVYVTANNIQKVINVTVEERDYLEVDATRLSLEVGEYHNIRYSASETPVFRSGNSSVVTVDRYGKITAKSAGSATIYVTSGNVERRVFVTVTRYVEPSTPTTNYQTVYVNTSGGRKIDFNVTNPSVRVNSTIRLFAAANYFCPLLNWASSNPYVATVDNNGNVRGVSEGTALIYAMDERGVASSYITVTVSNRAINKGTTNTTIYTNTNGGRKIDFNVTNPTVRINNSLQLNPTANYFNPKYTWISTNDNIASVDANGKIVGLKEGTTTIMVMDGNYASSEIVVQVIR